MPDKGARLGVGFQDKGKKNPVSKILRHYPSLRDQERVVTIELIPRRVDPPAVQTCLPFAKGFIAFTNPHRGPAGSSRNG